MFACVLEKAEVAVAKSADGESKLIVQLMVQGLLLGAERPTVLLKDVDGGWYGSLGHERVYVSSSRAAAEVFVF